MCVCASLLSVCVRERAESTGLHAAANMCSMYVIQSMHMHGMRMHWSRAKSFDGGAQAAAAVAALFGDSINKLHSQHCIQTAHA